MRKSNLFDERFHPTFAELPDNLSNRINLSHASYYMCNPPNNNIDLRY